MTADTVQLYRVRQTRRHRSSRTVSVVSTSRTAVEYWQLFQLFQRLTSRSTVARAPKRESKGQGISSQGSNALLQWLVCHALVAPAAVCYSVLYSRTHQRAAPTRVNEPLGAAISRASWSTYCMFSLAAPALSSLWWAVGATR